MDTEPKYLFEVRGELIDHPEKRFAQDWMVRLTIARKEFIDPATQQPYAAPKWREIDHTVVNHFGGYADVQQQTLMGLQRELLSAINTPQAVRTIVQQAGDILTVDWQDHPDGKQHPIDSESVYSIGFKLISEAKLTLAKLGIIAGG